MPNDVDIHRLGTTLGDAKIINLDEYRSQAEIRKSTAQDASSPVTSAVSVTTLVMAIVVLFLFWFGVRR